MLISFVNLSRILLLLIGLSVQQSKSDSSRNGIIMNGANETVDSGNAAASVDASIDKSAVQQKSVDDVNPPINGGIQHVQIEPRSETSFDDYMSKYLTDHPKAELLNLTNKDDTHELKVLEFNVSTSVDVVIHLLDINKYTNYLQINYTSAITNESLSKNFTKLIQPPNVERITFSQIIAMSILCEFATSESNRYRGFMITYELTDKNQAQPVNGISSEANAQEPMEKLNVLIEVPQPLQSNETWNLFRTWLTNSTNKFINATDMNVEKCSGDNITFVNISNCKAAWPNAQKCIKIAFSIRLRWLAKNKTTVVTDTPDIEAMYDSMDDFEMNRSELINMWIRFGRQEFANHGFKEFPIPDAKKLLVLWTSVSLAIIGAFLVILAAIWKMDVLRDYRRMYWKNGDDEKQICKSSDVSMYPPVHQTVPTLFPNDLSVSNNTHTALPFEYVNKPILYSISDFQRRPSLEESLKPSGNVKRKAGEVPFDTDFNDRPEDEVYFSKSDSTSPRLVN